MHRGLDNFKDNSYLLNTINQRKEENRVIFLDVNGAIMPVPDNQLRFEHDGEALKRYLSEKYNDPRYLEINHYDIGAVYYDWSHIALGYLRELLDKTGSNIVLSSNWRDGHPWEQLKAFFKLYDLEDYLIDRTPFSYDKYIDHAESIKMYLSEHPEIKKYIVFDDLDLYEDFGPNFKKVSNPPGALNQEDYNYGLLMLNGNPETLDDGKYIRYGNAITIEKHEFVIDGVRILYMKPIHAIDYYKDSSYFNFIVMDTYMKNKEKYDYFILDNKNINLNKVAFSYISRDNLITYPQPWWNDEKFDDVKKCLLSRIKR